jgi:hypothetical protein
MKKCLILALASVFAINGFAQKKNKSTESAPLTSQNQPKEEVKAADESTPAKTAQPITEEQKAKQKAITKEFKTAKAQIEADSTLTDEQKKAKLKEASKVKLNKMKEVFTPEQLQEMKENAKKKSDNN